MTTKAACCSRLTSAMLQMLATSRQQRSTQVGMWLCWAASTASPPALSMHKQACGRWLQPKRYGSVAVAVRESKVVTQLTKLFRPCQKHAVNFSATKSQVWCMQPLCYYPEMCSISKPWPHQCQQIPPSLHTPAVVQIYLAQS